jgi:type IV pilus assembly protein PilM
VRENVCATVSTNSVKEAATDVGVAASGADAVEYVKILIAAIHNEALNRYHDVVRESGLESRFFEIELFSTIRSLLPQDLEAHAVLDLGAGESKLYIIDRGLIRLSHIVSRGGQDITLSLSRALGISVEEAEKMKRRDGLQGEGHEESAPQTAVLNIIFSETSRTLLSFEHKFGRKVQNVLLSGGGANLAGVTALAQRNFSIPVERADPFKQVEAPAFLEEVLKQVGPEFTVALGIAFRELQESG